MHVKDAELSEDSRECDDAQESALPQRARRSVYRGTVEEDKELMRIFESTYGRITRKSYKERTVNEAKDQDKARERASARLKKPK